MYVCLDVFVPECVLCLFRCMSSRLMKLTMKAMKALFSCQATTYAFLTYSKWRQIIKFPDGPVRPSYTFILIEYCKEIPRQLSGFHIEALFIIRLENGEKILQTNINENKSNKKKCRNIWDFS